MSENRQEITLSLPLEEAEALHTTLENLLESGGGDARLERCYRLLGWRILAERGGSGLTGKMADIARAAGSLEEFESARDEALGPILDGLERGENRDP